MTLENLHLRFLDLRLQRNQDWLPRKWNCRVLREKVVVKTSMNSDVRIRHSSRRHVLFSNMVECQSSTVTKHGVSSVPPTKRRCGAWTVLMFYGTSRLAGYTSPVR